MPAPKKSLRPRARPKDLNKSIYGVEEGSTSSPDGIYVTSVTKQTRFLAETEKRSVAQKILKTL